MWLSSVNFVLTSVRRNVLYFENQVICRPVDQMKLFLWILIVFCIMHLILRQHFCKRLFYSELRDHPKQVIGPQKTHRESRSGGNKLIFLESLLFSTSAMETPPLLTSRKHVNLSTSLLRKVHHNSSEFSCAKYTSWINVLLPEMGITLSEVHSVGWGLELVKPTGLLWPLWVAFCCRVVTGKQSEVGYLMIHYFVILNVSRNQHLKPSNLVGFLPDSSLCACKHRQII